VKNKKVVIISLIVGIPVLLAVIGVLVYSQFLLLHIQSKKDLIGTWCNTGLEPDGKNRCESVIWGITIKNPDIICNSASLNPAPGSSGKCQYK